MALRFKPVDNVFYELLATSATHLVNGARILAEMLDDTADRKDIADSDAGRRARVRRDHPRDRQAGQLDLRHAVRP